MVTHKKNLNYLKNLSNNPKQLTAVFETGLTVLFISVPFYDLSNSLTPVKRQEKELNIFQDFPENTSEREQHANIIIGETAT